MVKQDKGEDYSAMRTYQSERAKESDIASITTEDMTVLVILMSCNNERLSQELMVKELMTI